MVYPPPPPHSYSSIPVHAQGQGQQQQPFRSDQPHYDHTHPNTSFAQNSYGPPHPHPHPHPPIKTEPASGRDSSIGRRPSREATSNSEAKRPRHISRRPSDEEEVEAGFALAGLGLGLSPQQVRERRDIELEQEAAIKPSIPIAVPGKKAVKGGKGAKSCSECRRLKAKCDRVFPCSNCECLCP